jgi:hypothetical protein
MNNWLTPKCSKETELSLTHKNGIMKADTQQPKLPLNIFLMMESLDKYTKCSNQFSPNLLINGLEILPLKEVWQWKILFYFKLDN